MPGFEPNLFAALLLVFNINNLRHQSGNEFRIKLQTLRRTDHAVASVKQLHSPPCVLDKLYHP